MKRLNTPTQQEVLRELHEEIDAWSCSFRESDGKVHDQQARNSIACLKTAISVISKTPSAQFKRRQNRSWKLLLARAKYS